MEQVILVGLAILWAVVLLPPYLQNRSENRPADSISTFRRELSVLERRSSIAAPGLRTTGAIGSSGLPVVGSSPSSLSPLSTLRPPMGRTSVDRARLARIEAKRRRRDVLVTLLAAAGLTLVLSFMLPAVIYIHLLVDVLLGAYIALLVRLRRRAEERRSKVRYLEPARRHAAVPAHAASRNVPAGLALREAAAR